MPLLLLLLLLLLLVLWVVLAMPMMMAMVAVMRSSFGSSFRSVVPFLALFALAASFYKIAPAGGCDIRDFGDEASHIVVPFPAGAAFGLFCLPLLCSVVGAVGVNVVSQSI